jgi:hypothetical protein
LALLLLDFEKMFDKMIWVSYFQNSWLSILMTLGWNGFPIFIFCLPISSLKANGEMGDSFHIFSSIKQGYCCLLCCSVDVLGYTLNNIKFAIMSYFLNKDGVRVD